MWRSVRLITSVGLHNIAGSIAHNGDLVGGWLAVVAQEIKPPAKRAAKTAAERKSDREAREEPPWYVRTGLVRGDK